MKKQKNSLFKQAMNLDYFFKIRFEYRLHFYSTPYSRPDSILINKELWDNFQKLYGPKSKI